MASAVPNPLLRHVRRIATSSLTSPLTDGQLLARFVADRDQVAFATLVGRYGPMVWAICRRVLGEWHAAEDAYQATFLVLARKAGSLSRGDLVGHWLYRVAYRIAVRARMDATRRRAREEQVRTEPAIEPSRDPELRELRAVLDEAVQRLPEKYRLPIVLCYVQGKTNAQAALLLGWPKGTVVTRLARARQRLQAYMGRRGFAGSVAVAVAALSQKETLPAGLAQAAVRAGCLSAGGQAFGAAAATRVGGLTEGALRSMGIMRLKMMAAAVMLMGLAATGDGLAAYQVLAGQGNAGTQGNAAITQWPEPEAKPSQVPRGTSSRSRPIADDLPCRFVVPITPIFEGGAVGVPALFEVGIKCQRPELLLAFEEELPDQVKSGLVAALRRMKSKATSGTGGFKCRFGVTITPWFEGGAVGEPILYTVEISGHPPEPFEVFEDVLPDQVRAGLLKTLRRMKAKQASAASPALEQMLDKVLDRLDVIEERLGKLEGRRRSSGRIREE